MTYKEWYDSLPDNKRAALDTAVKKTRNKYSDRRQWEKYKAVLGEKNLPKSLDRWQDLKYNDGEQWEQLKGFYKYKSNNPDADKSHYDIYSALKSIGINRGIVLPPEKVQAYILKDENAKKDPYHIMHRMKERGITDDEVRAYLDNALIMFSQWGGQRRMYVSADGVSVITKNPENWVFKTTWRKEDFDEAELQILEVIRKHAND